MFKVDADQISPTFVFVWDLVLIGENGLRSTLNPISFFVCDTGYLGDKKSGRSDLRPPGRCKSYTSCIKVVLMEVVIIQLFLLLLRPNLPLNKGENAIKTCLKAALFEKITAEVDCRIFS